MALFLTAWVIFALAVAVSSLAPPLASICPTSPTHPVTITWYGKGDPVFTWNATTGLVGYT